MGKFTAIGYICERCSHKWVPEDQTKEPRVCLKCRSPFWNMKPKEIKK